MNDQIICRLFFFFLDLRLTLFSVLSIMNADQVGNPEVDLEKLEFLCLKIGNSCSYTKADTGFVIRREFIVIDSKEFAFWLS